MKRSASVAAIILLLSTGPALAQDVDFKIFGAAAYVAPLGEEDVDFGSVRDSVEASDELGWAFGFEWRWSQILGLEMDYINSTQEVELGGTSIAEVDFQPITAGLNIHLINTTVVDFYVAPVGSYVDWGDIEITISSGNLNVDENIASETEFAWGAQAGLDIGLGTNFAIMGGVRWLNLDLRPDDGNVGEVGVDPLISRLGIALRF